MSPLGRAASDPVDYQGLDWGQGSLPAGACKWTWKYQWDMCAREGAAVKD
jgi:hypothetical protein